MADVHQQRQQQGGPSTARRRKNAAKSKPQAPNDWPRAGEPRSRASPRPKRHGDIDIDIVESSDDASAANHANHARPSSSKQPRRHRPRPPSSTASDTASDTTAPAKAPQRSPKRPSKSMRVPNASVPVLDTAAAHRRPTCIIEEDDDDDDDAAPSGPSRPVSRQTIARREISPRSAHRYRSTPESRRSPRTSVSDSEDDTDATSDSDEEQVIEPRSKHLPPAPMAPAVPPAPQLNTLPASLQERLSRRPEMVYEEEDGDGVSRYAPSVARHRSLSRPPSSRQDRYRRPRDIVVSGPPSLDETRRSRSRSKSARPSRRHYESDVYVSSRPASSFRRAHAASSYSLGSSTKRSTFFPDPAASSARPSHLEKQAERITQCVNCRDSNIPVSKTAKLKCCHRMCHSCLRKLFKLSLTNPQQHMPPRCCTVNIPTEFVGLLFDSSFKKEWNEKFMEHTGRGRVVCPSRRCGELMRPEDMRCEAGRWQGRCSRCRTKVCGSCRGRWHSQPECPRDEEAARFMEHARRESWQRCPRCKTVAEVKDGRHHMICRCGGEFCLVCGRQWKTCDCPFFNHDPFETDQANSRSNPFASRPASPRDRDFRSDFAPPTPTSARPRPSSYEEDPYMRRLHEQRDDHLTRRMHSFDAFGHHSHADFDRNRRDYEFDDAREPRERRRRAEYEASFPDDDYHRRAATVVAPSPPQPAVPAAPPPPRSAFDPPSRPAFDRSASGFDYGSPSHRARGARYASPERYDDYMMESYPPERRQTRSPEAWQPFPHEQRPRSRDRRHTFPTESRPTSPDTWQLPTRYPSPERPMPAAEDKRRAPSPDRRRASSLERRLAGRFKKESRQSPGASGVPAGAIGPVGPIGPISPGGILGPLSPTRVPPPPSRAATHIGASMPMAPVPPSVAHGAPSAVPALRRHHTMEEDVYGGPGGMHGPGPGPGPGGPPLADWFGPPLPHGPPMPHGHPHGHPLAHPPPPGPAGMAMGMGMGMGMMHHQPGVMHPDMVPPEMNINGGSPRAPHVRRRAPQGVAHREHNKYEVPRSSVLAGLGGMGRGMHRVSEWVNYVEPGPPEDAATVVQ